MTVIKLIDHSLSIILICRFHLDLQMIHAHPNYSDSGGIPSISLESFRAATQSLHDTVLAVFGDPIPKRDLPASESPTGDDVIPDIPEAITDEETELGELRSQRPGNEDAVWV